VSTLEAKAARLATRVHSGQVDQAGQPYIGHPERVAARLTTDEAKVVAWLHDVIEDGGLGMGDLIAAGIPSHVATAVVAISRQPDETPESYYKRVRANPLALEVKAADIADNTDPARLAALDEDTRERLVEKYAAARRLLGLPTNQADAPRRS
jgi:(p)ppGpp synthase/HD superfamily hydrolase